MTEHTARYQAYLRSGGSESNAEYMAWCGRHWREWRAETGRKDTDHEAFDSWLNERIR